MTEYRLYLHDDKGHIRAARELVCADDEEAVNTAKDLLQDTPGELWERGRCVRSFAAHRVQA